MDGTAADMNSRREFLGRVYNGIGTMALGALMADQLAAEMGLPVNPLTARQQHLPRKAKRCIFLFMQGGVSQVESFEYKPELNKLHGKPLPHIPNISGELQGRLSFAHVCVGSKYGFKQHGESGRFV